MRLIALALVLALTGPAVAGEALVVEKAPATNPAAPDDAQSPAPPADAPGQADKPAAPPVPYEAIYDAPVFGKANGSNDPKVDESALRFYAAQKNHARVDAEIRRLKSLYPAWKVPANLYAPAGSGNDEQPFWDLFGAGKLEELRLAIRTREQKELGWRPSADLTTKIARREAATALIALSDAKEWAHLLEAAARNPAVMTCASIDVDWRVAEAFIQLNKKKRGFEVYQAILGNCKNRDERLATVRKAIALLSAADVNTLIGMGATLPDGSGEFDAARLDLVRAQIGASMAEGAPNDVTPDALKLLGDATLRNGSGPDAALLGWYYYHNKAWADADGWFKVGLNGSRGDPKFAEGRVLALRNMGHLEEAEALIAVWRDRSPTLRSIYFEFLVARLTRVPPPAVPASVLIDFASLVGTDKNQDGAQALAWYSFNRRSWDSAASWFRSAVDWAVEARTDATLDPKILAGLVLSLQHVGRLEEAETIAYAYRDRGPELKALFISTAISALTEPDPAPAITAERYARMGEVIAAERSAAGASALGWRHLRDNDDGAAIDWFKSSIEWSADGKGDLKTNEGYALALKGAARFAEAEEVAYAWLGASADMRATYKGIVAGELTDRDLAEQMTEPRVARFVALVETEKSVQGAQALGWYRLHDSGCGYAVPWFAKAIQWSPDGKADAKTNEGYAQALQAVGRYAQAEDVAFSWSDRSPDMKAFYVKIVVDELTRTLPAVVVSEPRLARFADIVTAEHSANGAQALAWHRYRDAGCGYGVEWFALALAWSPDGRGDAKSNEGYASALRDVGRLAEAEAVLYPWVNRVALMRDIYIDVVVSELTRDDPPAPLPEDRLAAFVAVASPLKSAIAAQALGWYRYARHENPEAVRWFKLALDWWPPLPPDAERKPDTPEGYRPLDARLALRLADYRPTPRAYSSLAEDRQTQSQSYLETYGGFARTWTGYALALRAVGRLTDAEDVAFQWRDHWPALRGLFIDIAVAELTKPGTPALPEPRLKRFTSAIEGERSAPGAQALGWYYTGRKTWTEAAVWFKAALDWRAPDAPVDPKLVEGYAFALRSDNRPDEAVAIAAEWRDRIPAMKALYFDTTLDALTLAKNGPLAPERLAEITSLIEADKTPRSAMALGWYYFNVKDPAKALPWFKAAITAAPDGQVDPKAAEGFTLTLRALGRTQDALTFASAWMAKIPSLKGAIDDTVADLLTHANGTDTLAPDVVARLSGIVSEAKSSPDATAFGWYAFAHKDWAGAADWFRNAMAWSPDAKGDSKIAEGYAASLRNLCRYRDAEAVAAPWIADPSGGAVRTVFIDTVAERLARQKPFAPMSQAESERFAGAVVAAGSVNGAQALGWYSYNAKQYRAALAWFGKALDGEVTEGTVYGLLLTYRKLRDAEGLARAMAVYGARFPRLAPLARLGSPDIALEDARERDAKLSACARGGSAALGSRDATAFFPLPETRFPVVEPPLRADAATLSDAARLVEPQLDDAPPAARPRRRSVAPRPSASTAAEDEAPRNATSGGAKSGSAAAALSAKDYSRCLAIVEGEERGGRASATETQTKGWCLLGLERPEEAAIAFRGAQARGTATSKGDSAYGETLSLLRSGDTGAAAAVAGQASLTSERRNEVGLQVLSQQAYQAYQGSRWAETLMLLNRRAAFAAETRDLAMLRGYSLYQLGDYDSAKQVFTAVDRQSSDAESRRALGSLSNVSRDH